jgi:Heavy metal binding domain
MAEHEVYTHTHHGEDRCSGHAHMASGGQPLVQKAPVAPGTIYTCPMHPQIRQAAAGFCPICGMALEPEVASAEEGPSVGTGVA